MTTVYSNHNQYYEQQYKNAESANPYPDVTMKYKQKPNPSYKQPFQYFDSPVQNSHLFPNMTYIRPYNLDDVPVNVSHFINKSIEARKQYAVGPHVLTQRSLRLWD